MKKFLSVIFTAVLIFSFSGCGISFAAKKTIPESEIFSADEINRAMNVVCHKFAFDFDGCVLLEIEYDEEYSKERANDWAEDYGYEQGIVLTSRFYVYSDGDGSLEPGGTYEKWEWILARNSRGAWKLITWGYG